MSEILHDDVNVLEIHGIGDFSLPLSEGLYTWSGVSPERRRRESHNSWSQERVDGCSLQ